MSNEFCYLFDEYLPLESAKMETNFEVVIAGSNGRTF
jgi:hypothetical protein